MKQPIKLGIECVLLFGGIPLLLCVAQLRGGFPFLPVLFLLLAVTLFIGWRDPRVTFRPLTHQPHPGRLVIRVGLVAIALFLFTALLYPDLLLRLPQENPGLWLLILVLYPLLSVAPQEYLYRTFFMQRYQPVFGSGATMLWTNSLFFAFGHLFFLNWVAPVLSLLGGILLAQTWQKTKSFTWVCVEHALYGQMVFTSGIGWWFYTGSATSIQALTGN